ncbi:hypothetical protein B0H10DRAFT_1993999 [Mycena sp. CBHHK59/15]|nr:hypothetical protein B0H10DRAFT_1993999 [Mycena sp. CBHHK59/15]
MTPSRSLWIAIGTLQAVRAVAGIPQLVGSGRSLRLHGRQGGVPSVPPECESTCDPVNTILATNTCPPAECCTELFQSAYFNCLKCVGLALNATAADFAVAQQDVDLLTVSCFNFGFTLPELTLPGQNASRTLATSSRVSASATHVSQITISALPSSLTAPSSLPATISQKTVTTQPMASTPTSQGPAATSGTGTNSNTAVHRSRVDIEIWMLGLVAFGLMLV